MKDNKTQEAIWKAAEEEFLLKGFAGARTTEIARNAGVNHAMLHYYFKSKEQLFDYVMNQKMQQVQDSVAIVFQWEEIPVKERILEAMNRHFHFLCQNPTLPRFIINETITRPEYIEKLKDIGIHTLKEIVLRLQKDLDKAADEGTVCRIDAAELLMDIVSLNIFPFIVSPVLQSIQPGMDMDAFYERRRKENENTILQRLHPNKP